MFSDDFGRYRAVKRSFPGQEHTSWPTTTSDRSLHAANFRCDRNMIQVSVAHRNDCTQMWCHSSTGWLYRFGRGDLHRYLDAFRWAAIDFAVIYHREMLLPVLAQSMLLCFPTSASLFKWVQIQWQWRFSHIIFNTRVSYENRLPFWFRTARFYVF